MHQPDLDTISAKGADCVDRVPGSRRCRPADSWRRLADVAMGIVHDADCWRPLLAVGSTFRTALRLIQNDDYDAWLLHWPTGTKVDPHDHGDSRGVFTVVRGGLLELRWYRGLCRTRVVEPGLPVTVPAGVVHEVRSATGPSLSVHVYAPALVTMRFFDKDGWRLAGRWVADEYAAHAP